MESVTIVLAVLLFAGGFYLARSEADRFRFDAFTGVVILMLLARVVPILGYFALVATLLVLLREVNRFVAWRAYFSKKVGALNLASDSTAADVLNLLPTRPVEVRAADLQPLRKDADPRQLGQVGKLAASLRPIFEAGLIQAFHRLGLTNVVLGKGKVSEQLSKTDCYVIESEAGRLWYVGYIYELTGEGNLLGLRCLKIGEPFHPVVASVLRILSGIICLVLLGLSTSIVVVFLVGLAALLVQRVMIEKLLSVLSPPPRNIITEYHRVFEGEVSAAWEMACQTSGSAIPQQTTASNNAVLPPADAPPHTW